MNGLLPPEKQLCLNFSSGWLIKFQKLWDLKFVKLHGESGDADDEAIAASLPYIYQKLKNYNINDIWNADETGLTRVMTENAPIQHPTQMRTATSSLLVLKRSLRPCPSPSEFSKMGNVLIRRRYGVWCICKCI